MDIVQNINSEIGSFFNEIGNQKPFNLVKKNSENLSSAGDFSFPINSRIWQKHLQISDNDASSMSDSNNRLQYINEGSTAEQSIVLDELLERSKQWETPLEKLHLEGDRCLLHLHRLQSIEYALSSVITSKMFLAMEANPSKTNIAVNCCVKDNSNDLNSYRSSLVASVLRNLASYQFHVNERFEGCSLLVEVKPVKHKGKIAKMDGCRAVQVYCGNVVDNGHKVASISRDEYVSMRSKDMQLIAMHKYGVRVKNEERFRTLVDLLGEAASKVDLLEAKHTGPVSVKRNGQGCTKGAAFILYNSARIETLLRTFEEHVGSGTYPDLPSPPNIDMKFLKEEEEWKLAFNYILGFPNVIKRCLDGIEDGKCAPHLLLQFLFGLVSTFSVYYRRVRVLLDGRDHLVPVIHARIYLVHCLRIVFNRILAIFGIDPVQCM